MSCKLNTCLLLQKIAGKEVNDRLQEQTLQYNKLGWHFSLAVFSLPRFVEAWLQASMCQHQPHGDVPSTCTSSSGTLMLFAGGISCCHDSSSPLVLSFRIHSIEERPMTHPQCFEMKQEGSQPQAPSECW